MPSTYTPVDLMVSLSNHEVVPPAQQPRTKDH